MLHARHVYKGLVPHRHASTQNVHPATATARGQHLAGALHIGIPTRLEHHDAAIHGSRRRLDLAAVAQVARESLDRPVLGQQLAQVQH